MSERGDRGLRLIDAMPRPLLAAFVALGVVVIAAVVVVLVKPPTFGTVPLAQRRPPPRGTLSHDTLSVVPAPTPSAIPTLAPPCAEVAGARIIGGGDAVLRLRSALEMACRLRRGVSEDMTTAVRALDSATLRFATFGRTGAESTLDFSTNTLWLNIKMARTKLPVAQIVPVMLHEAWHLAHRDQAVTATQELDARGIEVAVCRQLVDVRSWPRWCADARALTELSKDAALASLRAAGYR